MQYDVSLRIQGGSANSENPMVLFTEGTLQVERGQYRLCYDQYEGDESVRTTISICRDTVVMERNDHSTVMFMKDRPSIQQCSTPTGRPMTLTVVPYAAQISQRRGHGWLHLVYDLVYDGHFTSNHDILFEFEPMSHGQQGQ